MDPDIIVLTIIESTSKFKFILDMIMIDHNRAAW